MRTVKAASASLRSAGSGLDFCTRKEQPLVRALLRADRVFASQKHLSKEERGTIFVLDINMRFAHVNAN